MNKSQSYQIQSFINENIKQGDKVYLIDGSALSLLDNQTEELYIVSSYPKITGSNLILKDIEATVKATGISDFILPGVCNKCYIQDIIVELNGVRFRTSSGMVSKIKTNMLQEKGVFFLT